MPPLPPRVSQVPLTLHPSPLTPQPSLLAPHPSLPAPHLSSAHKHTSTSRSIHVVDSITLIAIAGRQGGAFDGLTFGLEGFNLVFEDEICGEAKEGGGVWSACFWILQRLPIFSGNLQGREGLGREEKRPVERKKKKKGEG